MYIKVKYQINLDCLISFSFQITFPNFTNEDVKTAGTDYTPTSTDLFTFQYGKIKTILVLVTYFPPSQFTFQYGNIKTALSISQLRPLTIFTFQYGKIKTHSCL